MGVFGGDRTPPYFNADLVGGGSISLNCSDRISENDIITKYELTCNIIKVYNMMR